MKLYFLKAYYVLRSACIPEAYDDSLNFNSRAHFVNERESSSAGSTERELIMRVI